MGALMARGASARAAAATVGVTPRTLNNWLALGSSLEQPRPVPTNRDNAIEMPGGGSVTEMDWWAHEYACWTLARLAITSEGQRVAELMGSMWEQASAHTVLDIKGKKVVVPGDSGMQMFLFKHYKHVHGLNEKSEEPPATRKQGQDAGSVMDMGENAEKVVFIIPDNGRGPKP